MNRYESQANFILKATDEQVKEWRIKEIAIGGKLQLRERDLCFTRNKINKLLAPTLVGVCIKFDDISSVDADGKIRRLKIIAKNGQELEFVVRNKKEWKRQIDRVIQGDYDE